MPTIFSIPIVPQVKRIDLCWRPDIFGSLMIGADDFPTVPPNAFCLSLSQKVGAMYKADVLLSIPLHQRQYHHPRGQDLAGCTKPAICCLLFVAFTIFHIFHLVSSRIITWLSAVGDFNVLMAALELAKAGPCQVNF